MTQNIEDFLPPVQSAGLNTAKNASFTGTLAVTGQITAGAQVRATTMTALGATGTVSLDPTLGQVFTITPTGNVTLNAASAPAGAYVTVIVTTSGTNSYNITPTTNFKSTGALATGTASGKVFTIGFVGDGTNLNEDGRTAAM